MADARDRQDARDRDADDPLGGFRDQFRFPTDDDGEPLVYFCGNSLGLQPKGVEETLDREVDAWAELGVDAHFEGDHPWVSFNQPMCEPLADIVGAREQEVVVMNTLTANLHFMMVSFYQPTDDRHKILMEGGSFPSDRYAVTSQIDFHGYDPEESLVEVEPPEGEETLETGQIVDTIREHGDELELVLFTGVHYYTGQAFDLETIAEVGREVGANVGFDLAHAVGNVPLELHDWGADFAVWCHYKYINAGPGAVAGAFVHERHDPASREGELPRFDGWWGNDPETRFDMKPEFEPQKGAGAWQVSNAPLFSVAPLERALELFDRAGMDRLREKSLELGDAMLERLDAIPERPFEIVTPRDPEARGAQLSIRTPPGGEHLYDALRDAGVVCDYRQPRVIRVAPTPLYNSFEDVDRFCGILEEAVEDL